MRLAIIQQSYGRLGGAERLALSHFYQLKKMNKVGVASTFLTMTLTQGSGYILFGLPLAFFLGPLEGFAGAISVHSVTTLCLLLLLTGYVLAEPVQFKLEVLVLILITYTQAYFWFAIIGIQSL